MRNLFQKFFVSLIMDQLHGNFVPDIVKIREKRRINLLGRLMSVIIAEQGLINIIKTDAVVIRIIVIIQIKCR